MSKKEEMDEMGVAGAGSMGYQVPMGIKQRKKKVDEAMALDPELSHGLLLAYFNGMNDGIAEQTCKLLDEGNYVEFGNRAKEHAVREMIRNKMKEVVRKKAGGGGYVLYSPNQGKKKPAKPVGTFPTKLGAKKAELSRFPPKDPGKLKRLRKEVDRLLKDPKKRAEKEKSASKEKGTDDRGHKAPPKKDAKSKKEGVELQEASGFQKYDLDWADDTAANPVDSAKKACDMLRQKFKAVAKVKNPQGPGGGWPQLDIAVPDSHKAAFEKWLKDEYYGGDADESDIDAHRVKESVAVILAPGHKEVVADGPESLALLQATIQLMVNESLFHEEKTGSNWDDMITRLSKQALSSDKKFQALQKNIDKKTEKVLKDALHAIQKSVGKKVKIKEMGGIKVAPDKGKTYLPFSATVGQVAVEPIALYIEGGVPRIELSDQAKVALTKADPAESKLFRADLIQVQERILDRMDELEKAVMNRDRYLEKQEDGVDNIVAGLSPLQISLLKQVLVKKYRKIS